MGIEIVKKGEKGPFVVMRQPSEEIAIQSFRSFTAENIVESKDSSECVVISNGSAKRCTEDNLPR